MKQRYEEHISELGDQLGAAEQEQERLKLALSRSLDAGRRLQAQLSEAGGAASAQDVQTEVLA